MVYEYPGSYHNIGGYFEIDKISLTELQQVLYEKGISKIWKLRTILVRKLGFYFWKEVSEDKAKQQVFREEIELTNDEDCMEHLNDICRKPLNFSKPLWEFRLVENYANGKSVVFYKVHHSFMDGVGFVSLMSTLNDEQFTTRLPKNIEKPGLIQSIITMFKSPMILSKIVPEMKSWNTDENAAKVREFLGQDQQTNILYGSRELPFDKITKCYKKYPGMTFNDFMLAIMGKGYKQWYDHHGIQGAKEVMTGIPINLRNLPTGYHDLHIDNCMAATKFLGKYNLGVSLLNSRICIFEEEIGF